MKKLSLFLLVIVFIGCESKPKKILYTDKEILDSIKGSSDFNIYKKEFLKLSKELISKGICDINHYKKMGGWVKSSDTSRGNNMYFTYCGEMKIKDRIYINPTGNYWSY